MTPDVEEGFITQFGYVGTCAGHTKVPISIEFVPLQIACPCSGKECDPSRIITWCCRNVDCKEILVYDCRGWIYCKCGQVNIEYCKFLCPNPRHIDFLFPDQKSLFNSTKQLKLLKCMNILILGETGVGKSTWINSLVNYLSYDSLEEAEKGGMKSLIPTQFTVYTEDDQEIVVSTGSSKNEIHTPGYSATQTARFHQLKTITRVISLIDTPGIGDARGPIQDQLNFENILAKISVLDDLHGICIFLKPNIARLNVFFRFCIMELLTHLHSDASKNIIFCLTNSRSTDYRPGETKSTLMTLLNEVKTADMPFGPQNIFCYDSEAYRYLAAAKKDPPVAFTEAEHQNFRESWRRSTKETSRMIEYISRLQPHTIKNTLNLNNIRQLVMSLARPLAEINLNIQINKKLHQEYIVELEQTQGTVNELEKKRMMQRTSIKHKPLDHPKTVCTNRKCVNVGNLNGLMVNEYITACHNPCYDTGIQVDQMGGSQLLKCIAFGKSEFCRHCTHSYREHLHIYYDSVQVQEQVVNEAVDMVLRATLSDKERKQTLIDQQIKLISEYENEIKEIVESCAYFTIFLKNHAIAPFNDAYVPYLDHVISGERGKVERGGSSQVLADLIKSKTLYSEYLDKLLARNRESSEGQMHYEDIWKLVEDLKKMKHAGKSLTDAINCIRHTQSASNVSGYATVFKV